MRRDLTIKSGNMAGTSDFRVLATIKKGFIPALDAVTYKTRVKRVLKALHIGRLGAQEFELARILSDAVERVGRIHSVGIVVLEPEDKVLLTVTFDGAWEAYVRVIWQKVARLLDLIFCNTEDYTPGYESTYEQWGIWLKNAQSEASFLYATPGLTVDDTRYLRMEERIYRREAGNTAESRVTRIRIPTAEDIATQSIFQTDGQFGIDPSNAGFGEPLTIEEAGRPPFRHGVRSVVGLYRLADLYLPNTPDGDILHGAAHELLPEFVRMLNDGNSYQLGVKRALKRFQEAMHWILTPPKIPLVRQGLPFGPPDVPPLPNLDNVQGGILSNYPDGADHGCLLLLQFKSPAALAVLLNALRVTTEADQVGPEQVATNIAFTVEGLRAAGLSDDEVRAFPEEFVQGMDFRAGILGDMRVNHPRRWRLPAFNWNLGIDAPDLGEDDAAARIDLSAVHAALQVRLTAPADPRTAPDTAAARTKLMAAMQALVDADAGIVPLSLQWMQRRRDDAGNVEEHFGFRDGDSQPVLTKALAGIRYTNQVNLGEILCGYPNLVDKTSAFAEKPADTRALLQDGSFLVVRKLRQDIEALETALREAGSEVAAAGQTMTREEFMANMMGRWPGTHSHAGEPLAEVIGPNPMSNDFHFNKDPHGVRCPFHAHIRRVNPRITDPEEGSRPPRIIRRGMSYGPKHIPNAGDAQALSESLNQERGLIFMAYNANLGEQYEVMQRWLNAGNSSGSYSGQSDPFFGYAEPGRRRYFRFEHNNQTIRMPLDGSDQLHAEPRPFVRLEWGAYFFAPSNAALTLLRERAAAQGKHPPVIWCAHVGEKKIKDLREIETHLGHEAAKEAWKKELEDPDAAADFTTASIWAAIRERHGGVLQTPYGVLVADRTKVEEVFADKKRNLTITAYLPRMQRSFGVLYLGLDPDQEDHAYERESETCNQAIMALDRHYIFNQARKSTRDVLQHLVDEAISYAKEDHETHWDLTIDSRELVDPLLADFCESWFGLVDGDCFRRSGYRWDWKEGDPPNYPGHFLSPSRYIFQPHPGPEVESIGSAHGVAVRHAMVNFLNGSGAKTQAPVTRAVLDSERGKGDIGFVARTVAGAMMGFIPTVEGTLRRILNEWLRDGNLWSLRARYSGTEAVDFTDACNRLGNDFIPAMLLRAVPELIWRTATVSHTLGDGPHKVEVEPGDVVVAGAISATQQNLEEGRSDLYDAFGGNRKVAGHPTHACPGADPAVAVMIGFFSALVETPLPMRAGPGPLTLGFDGRLPPPPPQTDAEAAASISMLVKFDLIHPLAAAVTPIVVVGDSWLSKMSFFGFLIPSLYTAMWKKNYQVQSGMLFSSPGRRLKDMADPVNLTPVKNYLLNIGPNDPKPQALLLGGGGNDVTYPSSEPKKTPLYKMLKASFAEGEDPLDPDEVKKFIDGELAGYYKKILDTLTSATDLPIVTHAYDHPFPDDRTAPLPGPSWLHPIFEAHGMMDLKVNTKVMRDLIDRLNLMVANVAAAYPNRVYHVNLCGTLEANFGADYKKLWANELHPNEDGYDLIAALIIKKIKDHLNVS